MEKKRKGYLPIQGFQLTFRDHRILALTEPYHLNVFFYDTTWILNDLAIKE